MSLGNIGAVDGIAVRLPVVVLDSSIDKEVLGPAVVPAVTRCASIVLAIPGIL